MSTQIPATNPLAYVGIKETDPPQLYFRPRAPLATDSRPYDRGDIWIDTVALEAYILALNIGGVASWITMTTVGAIETLTGDAGGAVSGDGVNNLNLVGGVGISTTGTPGTNTVTIDSTGGFLNWTRVAGVAQAMAVDSGYVPTNAALTTLTLPAAAVVGDEIAIVGEGAGGWTIAQNAGQSIQFGNLSTTVGVGGSLASTNRWDTVYITCRVANTTWSVTGNVGVLNVT